MEMQEFCFWIGWNGLEQTSAPAEMFGESQRPLKGTMEMRWRSNRAPRNLTGLSTKPGMWGLSRHLGFAEELGRKKR